VELDREGNPIAGETTKDPQKNAKHA
jgi:hypothetical protein